METKLWNNLYTLPFPLLHLFQISFDYFFIFYLIRLWNWHYIQHKLSQGGSDYMVICEIATKKHMAYVFKCM